MIIFEEKKILFLIDNILTTGRPRVEIKVSGWLGG